MRMRADLVAHRLMALETGLIGIHPGFQLTAARPFCEIHLTRIFHVHLVTRNTGKFTAAKTWRCLHAIEFPSSHPDHSVAPEAIAKVVRLTLPDELFLLKVVG